MGVAASWRRAPQATRIALAAYALLSVVPFLTSGVLGLSELDKHPGASAALIATAMVVGVALLAGLLLALVLQRRWAWIVLLLLEGAVVVPYMWESGPARSLVTSSIGILVLLSPPMRRWVWGQGPPTRVTTDTTATV
jgi:hypothetical protein